MSNEVSKRSKSSAMKWDGDKNMQEGDRGRFLRHALAGWDLPAIDISDEKQVEERIIWYFSKCIEDDVKPTVSGMSSALGIHRNTFYKWGVGKLRADTHQELIVKTKGILEALWETYMQEGAINPIVGIFLGKNHFGYRDVKDITVEPRESVVEEIDIDDVLAVYDDKELLE